MSKRRVFISFDYDHDARIKDLLVGQAAHPSSPFEFADWSIKEHIDQNWKEKARSRIRSVDVVCVICGAHTNTALGVSAELRIAQEERKEYFLLGAHQTGVVKPTAALATDKVYRWEWENLKRLVGGSR
ncbi:MAG: TIR domain-containing protein [Gammaproteobacteria bacterium]